MHTPISRRNQSIRLIWLTSSSPLGLHPPYQQTGITNTSREASASMLALLREQIYMAHLLGTFSLNLPTAHINRQFSDLVRRWIAA